MKTMLIAEVGSVHDGSFGNACRLIEAARDCGAHAVKFQTHLAEAETLENAPSPSYFKAESRISYFKRTAFTREQWHQLSECAKSCGIVFLSSPFSLEAVDLLEEIEMPIYKIPSGEVTNLPLLRKIAKLGKPVLLSSGMSTWDELDRAMSCLKGLVPVTPMQCTSEYPCPPQSVGLNILTEMKHRYGMPVGYSDHTLGFSAPFAAAALGAVVIEKHFTFSRSMYGSDAKHSMEPQEFKILSKGLNEIWTMLESPVDKSDVSSLQAMKDIFEKSIVTSKALKKGTVLGPEHLAFKKPGTGISAAKYSEVLGRQLAVELSKDHLISESDFQSM